MSYDVRIKHKRGGDVILPTKHDVVGGTYALGGTDEARLNITYNYADKFCRVFGEKGIRAIYGKSVRSSMPMLKKAIALLGDAAPDEDYWKSTDGNACEALRGLLKLAELAIQAFPKAKMVWDGD